MIRIIFHPLSVEHSNFISTIYSKYKVHLSAYCTDHMNDDTWMQDRNQLQAKTFQIQGSENTQQNKSALL